MNKKMMEKFELHLMNMSEILEGQDEDKDSLSKYFEKCTEPNRLRNIMQLLIAEWYGLHSVYRQLQEDAKKR